MNALIILNESPHSVQHSTMRVLAERSVTAQQVLVV
jgi:hypothetical protein|tara:strand:+ start:3162 stop:3269 length:108 start_codon:yes stop_codon:yes gene_type:complete